MYLWIKQGDKCNSTDMDKKPRVIYSDYYFDCPSPNRFGFYFLSASSLQRFKSGAKTSSPWPSYFSGSSFLSFTFYFAGRPCTMFIAFFYSSSRRSSSSRGWDSKNYLHGSNHGGQTYLLSWLFSFHPLSASYNCIPMNIPTTTHLSAAPAGPSVNLKRITGLLATRKQSKHIKRKSPSQPRCMSIAKLILRLRMQIRILPFWNGVAQSTKLNLAT